MNISKKSYHDGLFFKEIGEEFDNLDKRKEIINADVLDAWYDPTPKIKEYLCGENFEWIIKTSPPTHCEGLINVISRVRNINKECILPNAGSSNNIFLGLLNLLKKGQNIISLSPTYGEYNHVFDQLLNSNIKLFNLDFNNNYEVNIDDLCELLTNEEYDLVMIVNPNSPTGQLINEDDMIKIHNSVNKKALLWIDETYMEYTDCKSLEKRATQSDNIIISKSMSKYPQQNIARRKSLQGKLRTTTMYSMTPCGKVTIRNTGPKKKPSTPCCLPRLRAERKRNVPDKDSRRMRS